LKRKVSEKLFLKLNQALKQKKFIKEKNSGEPSSLVTFLKKDIVEKSVRKMLVKLTPEGLAKFYCHK